MAASNDLRGEKEELLWQVENLRKFVQFDCTEEEWEEREKVIVKALTDPQLGLYRF